MISNNAMKYRFFQFFLLFCLAGAGLSGCGIKPRNVDPPPSVEKDSFPRQYPSE